MKGDDLSETTPGPYATEQGLRKMNLEYLSALVGRLRDPDQLDDAETAEQAPTEELLAVAFAVLEERVTRLENKAAALYGAQRFN